MRTSTIPGATSVPSGIASDLWHNPQMTWKLECGDYDLFVIEDGHYWRDPSDYHDEASDWDWRFHPRDDEGKVRLNFGCYLITNGDRTVMVDAGIGKDVASRQPGMVAGLMPQAFDALGIPRSAVEAVIYSHMHYDHIGGSQEDGRIVFPNARHVFHEREWSFWESADTEFARAAQSIMRPLLDQDRVDFIDRDTDFLPGVTAVESFGHTPGHLSVSLMSGGTRTFIGGDISNHPFQVEHPDWSLPVDNDPAGAAWTRDRIFEDLRGSGADFVAGHYPMPGIGKIVTDDGVRVYQPKTVPSL